MQMHFIFFYEIIQYISKLFVAFYIAVSSFDFI